MIEISQLGFLSLLMRSSAWGFLFCIVCEPVRALRLVIAFALRRDSNALKLRLFKRDLVLPHTVGCHRGGRIAKGIALALEFVLDAAAVISVGIGMILVSYSYNSGRMRWMIPVGFVLGSLAYRITVGRLMKRLVSAMIYALAALTVKLLGAAVAPIKRIRDKFKRSERPRREKKKENETKENKTRENKAKGGPCCES